MSKETEQQHENENEIRLPTVENSPERSQERAIPTWMKRAIAWFWLTGLAVFYFTGVVRALADLLLVLFLSLFLSFALEPAVNSLEKRGIRRGLGTGMVFLAVIIGVAGMTFAVGKALVDETRALVDQAPDYINNIQDWTNEQFGLEVSFDTLSEEFVSGGGAQNLVERFASDVLNAGATALRLLVRLLAGALFTFYLVADGPKFRRLVLSSLNDDYRAKVLNIWGLAIQKTGEYIYSRAALSTLSAIFHWIAFALLDVPSPLTLGLWVGIVSQFIPAVGTYIAGAMPVIIALLDNPGNGLWTLLVVIAYQQVENYIFAPRVTAHTMKMHVAVAFGSVITGITLLGIVGAFLALPCAATFQAWLSSWHEAHQARQGKGIQTSSEETREEENGETLTDPAGP